MFKITRLASVYSHGEGWAHWELSPTPLKAELLNILGVECNPRDVDVTIASLRPLVPDLAVHHLQIGISHLQL